MVNGSSTGIPPQPIQNADPIHSSHPRLHHPSRLKRRGPYLFMSVDMHMQSQQSGMEVVDPRHGGGGEQAQHLELPQEAMVVVGRTPTPLVQDTVPMTVEQLEQLRATCLGCVWLHRKKWDRDELLRELLKLVEEFSEEVFKVLVDDDDDT